MSKQSLSAEQLFTRAVELGADDREAFLKAACGDDVALRRQLDRLLKAHHEHSGFLPKAEDAGGAGNESASADLDAFVQEDQSVGTVIGRYKLLERLAEGGFGVVYVAEQEEPVRRRVALKLIKPGMDTKDVIARFEAERQALALMDHPNVAKVLDAGATERGRPYFVMELVHGIKVTEYCDKNRLTMRERLALFVDICRAVQHAHQKGIIHRDLKPSNILVTLHDGKPVPKVIDFGVAKALSQRLTEQTIYTSYGQMIGTPEYMSPEQAEMSGLGIDTRSDIYSLAVLLYEMLTGQPPFDGKRLRASGFEAMMRIIREEEPPRASVKLSTLGEEASVIANHRRTDVAKLRHSLRGELDWILMKGLEKDRSRRYETANGFAADVERFLNNEAVIACPPSTVYRLRKFVGRNKAVVLGTAVLLLVLIGGLVGTTAGLITAKQQRDKAQRLADVNEELIQGERAARTQAEAARRRAEYNSYILQINVAAANVENANPMVARSALLATPAENRNWEWGYLVGQAWPAQVRVDADNLVEKARDLSAAEYWGLAPSGPIKKLDDGSHLRLAAVTYGPQDKIIVTTAGDSTVRLWDPLTGDKLQPARETTGAITQALAVSHDGTMVVVGDSGGVLAVLEVGATVTDLWTQPAENQVPISTMWFTPDDAKLVVPFFNGRVVVRDARSGRVVCSFREHASVVQSARFSPDGRRVMTISRDGPVRAWDLETGSETEKPRFGPSSQVAISVQTIHPDRQHVATGLHDGSILIWHIETGEVLKTIRASKQGHAIEDLIFSLDGSCLVAMVGRESVQVIDTATGDTITTLEGPLSRRPSIAINQDGSRIATNSRDGITQIWAPVKFQEEGRGSIRDGHDDVVVQAAFSHDGTRIVTTSYDKTVKIWDARTKKLIATCEGHEHEVLKANFSPDDRYVASISTHGSVRVWDSNTGEERFGHPGTKQFLRSASSEGGIRGNILAFSAVFSASLYAPTGNSLLTFGDDGMAVLDSLTGRQRTLLEGSPTAGWPVISPVGKQVAMITDTLSDMEVWDLASGRKLNSLSGHSRQADWAHYSRDGSRLLTSSMDTTTIVWDTKTGQQLHQLEGHEGNVPISRFNPDATRVASASTDGTAKIWDAETGECLSTFTGHTDRLTNVEFSPDGERVLTTAIDNTIRIWEPMQAREFLKLSGDSRLTYGTWSPDGRSILTCWRDGAVRLFEAFPWDQIDSRSSEPVNERVRRWRNGRLAR